VLDHTRCGQINGGCLSTSVSGGLKSNHDRRIVNSSPSFSRHMDCMDPNYLDHHNIGVFFSATFWTFWCRNPTEKFEVKLWFALFKLDFWLYIWIQHPEKPLGHFDCARVTHQACDLNKFLSNFREIRREKLPKSLTKDHIIYSHWVIHLIHIWKRIPWAKRDPISSLEFFLWPDII